MIGRVLSSLQAYAKNVKKFSFELYILHDFPHNIKPIDFA